MDSNTCELWNIFQELYNTFLNCAFELCYKTTSLKLYIKYMLSVRSKMEVKEVLKQLGLHFIFVDMGEVEIMEDIPEQKMEELKIILKDLGMELIEDKKGVLIQKIKNVVLEIVYHSDEQLNIKFSHYLSQKLNLNYTYLANLFSEMQGTTIEQFLIQHKIERIKELIIYDELNITEISHKMNYSSVAHLSNQFKKVTGLSPSHFKQLKPLPGFIMIEQENFLKDHILLYFQNQKFID